MLILMPVLTPTLMLMPVLRPMPMLMPMLPSQVMAPPSDAATAAIRVASEYLMQEGSEQEHLLSDKAMRHATQPK